MSIITQSIGCCSNTNSQLLAVKMQFYKAIFRYAALHSVPGDTKTSNTEGRIHKEWIVATDSTMKCASFEATMCPVSTSESYNNVVQVSLNVSRISQKHQY